MYLGVSLFLISMDLYYLSKKKKEKRRTYPKKKKKKKNLAPCFTRASAMLLPHALGDTRPWHHRSPFAFDYLTTYIGSRGSEHGFEIRTRLYGLTEKTMNLSFLRFF